MQYTWNGGDGSYTDASQWTPAGVPLYDNGSTALIRSGTVTLSDVEPNAVLLTLAGADAATQPNLVLDNAAIGPQATVSLVLPDVRNPPHGYATITADGYDTNYGTITTGGFQTSPDDLAISISPYGQLNQEGTIEIGLSCTLRVDGTGGSPATLNNDGTIYADGGSVGISADIVGSGTVALRTNRSIPGSVEFSGGVSSGQRISFLSGDGTVRIDDPTSFHGVFDGFAGGSANVVLDHTHATSTYFAQVTPDAGALLLLDGQSVVAALTVSGQHASNAYGVSSNPDGSATVSPVPLLPTT